MSFMTTNKILLYGKYNTIHIIYDMFIPNLFLCYLLAVDVVSASQTIF